MAVVSFRYHLVSLSAALLALAVGLVVGSAALGPVAAKPTSAPAVAVAPAADAFVRAVGPRLVTGALKGQRVLVLLAPDARPIGLLAQLELAGAEVTGQLRLRPALLDDGTSATVDDVVTRLLPAGLTLPATSAVERAGVVLASALVTSTRGTDASAPEQQQVIGGFTAAGLLSGIAPEGRATLVLLVAGPSRGAALASVGAALASRVGVVVAGPLAATRGAGALAAVRAAPSGMSDVDGAETPQGLVATVLALAEQAAGGSGHYGTGPGARDVVPDLS